MALRRLTSRLSGNNRNGRNTGAVHQGERRVAAVATSRADREEFRSSLSTIQTLARVRYRGSPRDNSPLINARLPRFGAASGSSVRCYRLRAAQKNSIRGNCPTRAVTPCPPREEQTRWSARLRISSGRWHFSITDRRCCQRPRCRTEEVRLPASPTPKSRSATSCRTAGRHRPTASSARR